MSYIKPIPLEELPYTPVELGEMLENDEKEREIEVEGYGKGRLVISKQNKNKPFFYADEANIPANEKAIKQLQIAETAFNAPLLLSPLLGLASGIPKIAKDRTRAQIKKARMGADELYKDNAVNLNKTVDGVFQMRDARFQTIAKIARQNKISYKQAEEYVNLKLKGTEPKGTLNPGSSRETLQKRFMKSPKDRFPDADNIKGSSSTPSEDPTPPKTRKERRIGIDVSTNEKLKQSLLRNDQIELPPAYLGGPKEFRDKADFFDVSAAIMGGGKEDMIDPATGKYFKYDRLASTEFGKTAKSKNRAIIFNHIKENIGAENIMEEEERKLR